MDNVGLLITLIGLIAMVGGIGLLAWLNDRKEKKAQ
jgi:hypothetical protein